MMAIPQVKKEQRGNVLIVALPLILAISLLGWLMVSNSANTRAMGSDTAKRAQAFHAADGIIAALGQEILYNGRDTDYVFTVTKSQDADGRYSIGYGSNSFTQASPFVKTGTTMWRQIPEQLNGLPRLLIDTTKDSTPVYSAKINKAAKVYAVSVTAPGTAWTSAGLSAKTSQNRLLPLWTRPEVAAGILTVLRPKTADAKWVYAYIFEPVMQPSPVTLSTHTIKYYVVPQGGDKFAVRTESYPTGSTALQERLGYVIQKGTAATPGLPFGNALFVNGNLIYRPTQSQTFGGDIFVNGNFIMVDPDASEGPNGWAQIRSHFGYVDTTRTPRDTVPCRIKIAGTLLYREIPCDDRLEVTECGEVGVLSCLENLGPNGLDDCYHTNWPDFNVDRQFFINYWDNNTPSRWHSGLQANGNGGDDRFLSATTDEGAAGTYFKGGVTTTAALPSLPDPSILGFTSPEQYITYYNIQNLANQSEGLILTNSKQSPAIVYSTTSTFYDLNCWKSVRVTEVDIGATLASGSFPPNFNGVLYIAYDRSPAAGEINGVRIVNAASLDSAKLPKGLLIATPYRLYTKGNFNHPYTDTASGSRPFDTLYAKRLIVDAGIIADAVTMLSNNWNDARCQGLKDLALRNTDNNFANRFCCVKVDSTRVRTYGGSANFPTAVSNLNMNLFSIQVRAGWAQGRAALVSAKYRCEPLRNEPRSTWINAVIYTGFPKIVAVVNEIRGSSWGSDNTTFVTPNPDSLSTSISPVRFMEFWAGAGASSFALCGATWRFRPLTANKGVNINGSVNALFFSRDPEYSFTNHAITFGDLREIPFKVWEPTDSSHLRSTSSYTWTESGCLLRGTQYIAGPSIPPANFVTTAKPMDPPAIGTAAVAAQRNNWRRYYGRRD